MLKKSLEDCEDYTGSSKQALDFETTTKLIINHAQESFDSSKEIDEVLSVTRILSTDEWRTVAPVRKSDDRAACDRESREFELDCKGELANCRKHVREHEKDLGKVCEILWRHCQLTLCDRIETQSRVKASIRNNTIELMLVIE